ncbi:serine protease [Flavivirga sp. 57AJ16]|uniref:S1 family peptidase n=1 Tax=Flavivirga sp. 57AJ16 TaxID=3025307 RepID=UPI0023667F43|nr:serine protease [Flavivirga sp. 57AJ16]MDD7888018.1 serine protease [Flavivirga sp. 57AJ16]
MNLRLVVFAFFFTLELIGQNGNQYQSIDFVLNNERMKASFAKVKNMIENGGFLTQDEASKKLISKQNKKIKLKKTKINQKELEGADVYRKLLPSTVVLVTNSLRASGYIISSDGVCVTNYHVVKMYSSPNMKKNGLIALTHNNEPYFVTDILATSPENDLAIVKIDTRGKVFSPLSLGSFLPEGNRVYVLGHPSHITYYFSEGIVAKNFIRNPEVLKEKEQCYMAITADYGIGASGAPVVDNKGNIVGTVSTAKALYPNPNEKNNPQMVLRNTIPVIALKQLIEFD